MTIVAEKELSTPRSDKYKLWFDLTLLVSSHLLLFPVWLLLWVVIPVLIHLEDRGPVFYKQKRVGKNGHIISILKFRTMVEDAESKGPPWTTAGDSRVTRVGKLLRRTALDELPEIINIWKREMSFVGPRALDLEEQKYLEKMVPRFEDRLQMLPGLTGLAQVYDKTDDGYEKFRYDLEYLRTMSPWLDMKLLLLSVSNTLIAKWDHRQGKPIKITDQPRTGDLRDSSADEVDEKQASRPKEP